ncbi:MAG TPA: ATP-binding protein [Terriglobales bacterium]|nr:ATP-binding protein [Terriglobales bacterium]
MKFRRKLLLVFALTVVVCVAAVAWISSALARGVFEKADEQRTAALVAQFRREFDRRGEEIARRVDAVAKSEAATRMALSLSPGPPDYAAYLNEAQTLAETWQLDFLEFVDGEGTILSSTPWPAKFGYKESFPVMAAPRDSFLKQEQRPDSMALALVVVRRIPAGDSPLYVMGGRKLDKDFLASLEPSAGMKAFFYQNLGPSFTPQFLITPTGVTQPWELLAPIVQQVQQRGKETTSLIHWSSDAADDEMIDAIPLAGADREVLGILLVATSRKAYVELEQQIRSAAVVSGAAGIVLAILLSGWIASRVTRPVEQLAHAAQEIAAGHWNSEVNITSHDELGDLAQSFNRMTRELRDQRERLVQAERVAAWRDLARRLAHELKNPLFPLQLTIENLLRARQGSREQFDEIFQEGSSTLLAEIANLKAVVSRFSEFSKMPQPRFQQVQLNELVHDGVRLFQSQLGAPGHPPIECRLEMDRGLEPLAADPELLHRALANLILNAIEAMPNGGTLTLRTHQKGDRFYVEVSDTGSGLQPEQRERLFTPYFTTKQHGTGLGLAILQSVVSDHGGRITVRSNAGEGTTFSIELPRNADKLQPAEAAHTTSGS